MNIVKEYTEDKTIIRFHNDYIKENEQKEIKEIIIAIAVDYMNNI